jgi:hypothetical protein
MDRVGWTISQLVAISVVRKIRSDGCAVKHSTSMSTICFAALIIVARLVYWLYRDGHGSGESTQKVFKVVWISSSHHLIISSSWTSSLQNIFQLKSKTIKQHRVFLHYWRNQGLILCFSLWNHLPLSCIESHPRPKNPINIRDEQTDDQATPSHVQDTANKELPRQTRW